MFNREQLREDFVEFSKLYQDAPIKDNFSGIKVEHAFGLYSILKKINPSNVIESGVFKGQSTWIIEKALPNAQIFCIEPNQKTIEYKSKKAKYFSSDILDIQWDFIDQNNTVIFFDDHVCLSKRLKFLKKNNFSKIIFDDNLPSEVIGYITPQSIMKETFLKSKIRVPYRYAFRLIKNLLFYFLKLNDFKSVVFRKNFMEFNRNEYDLTLINNLKNVKNNFHNYYEFPPLLAFDFEKKFKKQIKRYKIDYSNTINEIQEPIFKVSNSELRKYSNEISYQYGCICYFEYL